MGAFEKLELSTETLRQLTEEELRTVAGGDVMWTPGCPLTLEIAEKIQYVTELTTTTGGR